MSNNSFAEQFKAIWTILDCNYLIWDYEAKFGVDWNEIYAKYLPVFKEIDAAYAIDERNKISTDSLKRIYEEFLLPLHDGHLNITIDNLHNGDSIKIKPSYSRNVQREDYYDEVPSIEFSIDNDELAAYNAYNWDLFAPKSIVYCCFKDNIVYLRLSHCVLAENLTSKNEGVEIVWKAWFDKIQSLCRESKLKGVIFDMRDNNGGSSADYKFLLGAIQKTNCNREGYRALGKGRLKKGVGKYDYTAEYEAYFFIYPEEHAVIEDEPVVVLANCKTKSMAEMICLGAKQMTNGCVIGMRTWGGINGFTGLIDNTMFGDKKYGSFDIYMPILTRFTDEGECIEGFGVKPDIEVRQTNEEGHDAQLERALEYIRTGK